MISIAILGKDVLHAGIATHYCESAKIPDLEDSLLHSGNDVEAVINDFCPKVQSEFGMAKNLDQINECFDAVSVEEILSKLQNDNSEWAKKTIKVFECLRLLLFIHYLTINLADYFMCSVLNKNCWYISIPIYYRLSEAFRQLV